MGEDNSCSTADSPISFGWWWSNLGAPASLRVMHPDGHMAAEVRRVLQPSGGPPYQAVVWGPDQNEGTVQGGFTSKAEAVSWAESRPEIAHTLSLYREGWRSLRHFSSSHSKCWVAEGEGALEAQPEDLYTLAEALGEEGRAVVVAVRDARVSDIRFRIEDVYEALSESARRHSGPFADKIVLPPWEELPKGFRTWWLRTASDTVRELGSVQEGARLFTGARILLRGDRLFTWLASDGIKGPASLSARTHQEETK